MLGLCNKLETMFKIEWHIVWFCLFFLTYSLVYSTELKNFIVNACDMLPALKVLKMSKSFAAIKFRFLPIGRRTQFNLQRICIVFQYVFRCITHERLDLSFFVEQGLAIQDEPVLSYLCSRISLNAGCKFESFHLIHI